MNKQYLLVFPLFVALVLTACSTHIMLSSVPEQAHLVVAKSDISGTMPISASIHRTTFGKYPFKAEKEGYEPMYGVLPLNVSGTAITMDVLFFAPAAFWTAQRAFPFYQFDLEKQVIRYKKSDGDDWKEYPITEQERAKAKSFFEVPPR